MILTQKSKLYSSIEDKIIVDKLSYHSARLYNSCIYNIKNYYEYLTRHIQSFVE